MSSILHFLIVNYYEKKVKVIDFDWAEVNEEDQVQSIPFLFDPEEQEDLEKQPEGVLIADIMPANRVKKYIELLKKKNKTKLTKLQEDIF